MTILRRVQVDESAEVTVEAFDRQEALREACRLAQMPGFPERAWRTDDRSTSLLDAEEAVLVKE